MAKPTHRIVMVRKDKAEQTFKNYKNETVTNKYRKIGVIFPGNEPGRAGSLVLEVPVTVEMIENHFFNVYPEDDKPKTDAAEQPASKPKGRKAPKSDDSDLNFE